MRILLADHRSKIRFALCALLEQQPGVEIVGEAVDAGELLTLAETVAPDLVLLDWKLWGLVADDLLSALRKVCSGVRIIALSSRPEERQAALDAGADAFVSKIDPPERLLAVIDNYYASGS